MVNCYLQDNSRVKGQTRDYESFVWGCSRLRSFCLTSYLTVQTFIYSTTNAKHVIQLIQIIPVITEVCAGGNRVGSVSGECVTNASVKHHLIMCDADIEQNHVQRNPYILINERYVFQRWQ